MRKITTEIIKEPLNPQTPIPLTTVNTVVITVIVKPAFLT